MEFEEISREDKERAYRDLLEHMARGVALPAEEALPHAMGEWINQMETDEVRKEIMCAYLEGWARKTFHIHNGDIVEAVSAMENRIKDMEKYYGVLLTKEEYGQVMGVLQDLFRS